MSAPASVSSAAIDRENPWPGLASFTEDARGYFFGRDRETDELARLVRRETLTVLFGQSGLGKSSLLQAGLFPLLRDSDHLPLYLRLDHAADAPPLAEQVKSALADAFAAVRADAPAIGPDETLWEYFHRKDVDIWSPKNRLLTPVLAFDQFEEIFTLGRVDEPRRARSRAFLSELAGLVENRAPAPLRDKFDRAEADPTRYNFDKPSCRVILSLREDFLPDLEGLKQELPALVHNRLRLKRLDGTQALDAVARPAPDLLAEGVGERIVEFVSGARGGSVERLAEMEVEPALLSVICRELNERRRRLAQPQITADLVSGNRREILTDFYERSVADLPDPMRRFVEDRLLTKSGFRDNLALETALEEPGVTRALIDTLVARRLLRIEDRLGTQRVELTHDVLADVVRSSRDTRQQRLALEAAEARERAALAESRARARRQRWIIGGLATAVAALLVGAFFGLRAQRRAEARASSDAAQASHSDFLLGTRALDEGRVSEGLAYLVRAGRKDPANPVVGPRLLTELAGRTYSLPTHPPLQLPAAAIRAKFDDSGRWVVVETAEPSLLVLDVASWTVARKIALEKKPAGWGLARGTIPGLAVLFEDWTVARFDLATGRTTGVVVNTRERGASRVYGSTDGRFLALGLDQETQLLDWDSGSSIATVKGAGAVTFSHKGDLLATFADEAALDGSNNRIPVTRLWSTVDGSPVGKPIIQDRTYGASSARFFNADATRLYVHQRDAVVGYDIASGTRLSPVIPLKGTGATITSSPDGSQFAIVGLERSVTVYDVATGQPAYPPLEHGGRVVESTFSADGSLLFTNSIDGLFRIWNARTGKLMAEPTFKQDRYAPATVSPDGRTVALITGTGQAHLLRLTAGPAQSLMLPRDSTVRLVNFMPEPPSRLAWVTPADFKSIDVRTGQAGLGSFALPSLIASPSGSLRSSYGSTLGEGDVMVLQTSRANEPIKWRAWIFGRDRVEHNVEVHDVPADATSFRVSQRGERGIVISNNGRTLGVWNLRTGRRIAEFSISRGITRTFSGDFTSPDGHLAAFVSAGEVSVGEITSQKIIHTLKSDRHQSRLVTYRFTPDSRQLLTGDDWGAVQVWDARTGERLQDSQVHRDSILRFDFSPDGRFYSSLSADGSVQVWDTQTHTAVGQPLTQAGAPRRTDFSPDATRIVTPSTSGTARIWDVRTGLALTPPFVHIGASPSVVGYGPDGRFVECHGSNSIWVWAAPPAASARTPDWLLDLATVCAFQAIEGTGRVTNARELVARFPELRRRILAMDPADPYVEWAQWFLSEAPDRPIAPGFAITPAEAAKLREGTETRPKPAP